MRSETTTEEGIFTAIASLIRKIYNVESVETDTDITSFKAVSEDHEEFFRQYQGTFQIDMSKLDYYDFFDEDQLYILAWANMLKRRFQAPKKKRALTISHLVTVAAKRKWSPAD